MLTSQTPYVDGWFGGERELTVIPIPKFPFQKNPTPDIYSRTYDRVYVVTPEQFVPKIARRTAWTNLLTYSEQFDNAAWTKVAVTVTANAGTAPDGQTTLDKVLETTATSEHSVAQAATVTAAASEASVFAVAGLGRDWIKLTFTDSAATAFSAFFNVAGGMYRGLAAGTTAEIVGLGNGQFQCVIRFTPAAGAGTFKANVASDSATISYAGDAAKGVYLWGAQVATGTRAPYVSTTTVTRAVSAPDRDRRDPLAYLSEENDPTILTSASSEVRRTFSRIPGTQTVPSSIQMFRPAISGTVPQNVGDFRVFQPDSTIESYDSYTRKTVTSDSGAPGGNYPTGGTYTLSLAGGSPTSATNYNAVFGTLQTNLNAVTEVSNRGNCVVTGTFNAAGGFTVTFNDYAALTTTLTSLTGTTGIAIGSTISTSSGGYVQSVQIAPTGIDAGSPDITDSTTGGTNVYKSTGGPSTTPGQSYFSYAFDLTSTFGDITGGTYTLTLYAQTTAAIAFNANAATVQAAVNLALTNAAARGTVVVSSAGLISQNGYLGPAVRIQITPLISGGTFTATIFGQTTAAIAYNASLSTIQTRFNALSEVQTKRGGVVVSGAGFVSGVMSFTITFGNPLLVAATGSLTPAGSTMTVASADGGVNRIQTITFNATNNTRTFFVQEGHGISASDTIMIRNASADYAGIVGTFTVPNSQTLSLTILPSDAYATAATITEVGRRTKQGYQPGYSNVPASVVSEFFLPGVSVGITTADDIPVPDSQSDNTTVLAAIFSVTPVTLNWEGGRIGQWNRTNIIMLENTTINAADI